jgi:ABC-type branched-subunit amino acid transport system substrate-binding protein
VVGEICSAATVAAAGVATSSRLPLISPAATSPALSGNDMFFRTVPSDKFQGQAAANLLIKKGYRNVAIVYEDAAYGYGLAFNFIAAFTKGTVQVWSGVVPAAFWAGSLLSAYRARHTFVHVEETVIFL